MRLHEVWRVSEVCLLVQCQVCLIIPILPWNSTKSLTYIQFVIQNIPQIISGTTPAGQLFLILYSCSLSLLSMHRAFLCFLFFQTFTSSSSRIKYCLLSWLQPFSDYCCLKSDKLIMFSIVLIINGTNSVETDHRSDS